MVGADVIGLALQAKFMVTMTVDKEGIGLAFGKKFDVKEVVGKEVIGLSIMENLDVTIMVKAKVNGMALRNRCHKDMGQRLENGAMGEGWTEMRTTLNRSQSRYLSFHHLKDISRQLKPGIGWLRYARMWRTLLHMQVNGGIGPWLW